MKVFFCRGYRRLLTSALAIGLFCFSTIPLYAAQMTLQWNANNPAPQGYRLFQRIAGSAYNYSTAVWTGSATACTIANLLEGTTYYFVVRAYQGTTVSGDSNEVAFTPSAPVPTDVDGDGYSVSQGDCNDTNAAIHPGATDICGDGIDQNCNGSDLICPENTDNDGDGYTETQGDCNDANASVHPAATEICGDGIDQNCNGGDLTCSADPESVTRVFGDGPDADYPGTVRDTFLNINSSVNVSQGQLNTYTWPRNMPANAVLIKFDLSRIPADARITSAILTLYQTNAGGDAAYDVSAHKVIHHNPDPQTANGLTYDGVHNWTANTGCYNGVPLAQADIAPAEYVNSLDRSLGYKNWDITGMVQDWVIDAPSNYGVLLNSDAVAAANSFRFFASSEASNIAQRPILEVTYTRPVIKTAVFGNAPDADYTGTVQDTFLNINSSVNISQGQLNTYTWPQNRPANAALIKFDLSQLPAGARIESAILTLYQTGAGGDAAYDVSVHKVINHNPDLRTANGFTYDGANNWTANTACYNGIPLAQADIAPAEDVNRLNASLGYKTWDVTGMVEEWASNSAANFGLMLNSDAVASADSHRFFASSEASDADTRPSLVITYSN